MKYNKKNKEKVWAGKDIKALLFNFFKVYKCLKRLINLIRLMSKSRQQPILNLKLLLEIF